MQKGKCQEFNLKYKTPPHASEQMHDLSKVLRVTTTLCVSADVDELVHVMLKKKTTFIPQVLLSYP